MAPPEESKPAAEPVPAEPEPAPVKDSRTERSRSRSAIDLAIEKGAEVVIDESNGTFTVNTETSANRSTGSTAASDTVVYRSFEKLSESEKDLVRSSQVILSDSSVVTVNSPNDAIFIQTAVNDVNAGRDIMLTDTNKQGQAMATLSTIGGATLTEEATGIIRRQLGLRR